MAGGQAASKGQLARIAGGMARALANRRKGATPTKSTPMKAKKAGAGSRVLRSACKATSAAAKSALAKAKQKMSELKKRSAQKNKKRDDDSEDDESSPQKKNQTQGRKRKRRTEASSDETKDPAERTLMEAIEEEEGEAKPEKRRKLRKNPSDELLILQVTRHFPWMKKGQMTEKDGNEMSILDYAAGQRLFKEEGIDHLGSTFWDRMQRIWPEPGSALEKLVKTHPDDPVSEKIRLAVPGVLNPTRPDFSGVERFFAEEQEENGPFERDAIMSSRTLLRLNFKDNEEHFRAFEVITEGMWKLGMHKKFAEKLERMHPYFDKFLCNIFDSKANTNPATAMKRFEESHGHLIELVMKQATYDKLKNLKENDPQVLDNVPLINEAVHGSELGRRFFLKLANKISFLQLRKIIDEEKQTLADTPGTVTMEMFSAAKKKTMARIYSEIACPAEVEGKRIVRVAYRKKRTFLVEVHSAAELVGQEFGAWARAEAVEYEELEELFDEHASFGQPAHPRADRGGAAATRRIELKITAKAIGAREQANSHKDTTENTDTAKGLANLIKQIRKEILKADIGHKLELGMWEDIGGDAGKEMWRGLINDQLPNIETGYYPTLAHCLTQLRALKNAALAGFIHRRYFDELEVVIQNVEKLQTYEEINMKILIKSEYYTTVLNKLPLFCKTEGEDGLPVHGATAMALLIKKAAQKHKEKKRLSKDDFDIVKCFPWLLSAADLSTFKELGRGLIKDQGCQLAQVAAQNTERERRSRESRNEQKGGTQGGQAGYR